MQQRFNKHIMLVEKWLIDHNSVSHDQLQENYITAYDTNCTLDSPTVAAFAALTDDCATQYWLEAFYRQSGDNRGEYLAKLKREKLNHN
ncbi:MAG: hypothetical protein MJK10_19180 [Pseudomonadales bacterium]|nr:hypothetical protein [Pseudomonadales bacterium]NRA15257.1 hypothetical protein [Oceanospirillaceae bacterium]